MQGVGELFGQSVDAILRRPRTILVPLFVDIVVLVGGTFIFVAFAGVQLLFPQGYRLPGLLVAVPHALPTVGDVIGPEPALQGLGVPVLVAALVLIVLSLPFLAYAEAGFLGVLRALHLAPADPLAEGRHVDAWSRIGEAFRAAGKLHFATFLVLRGIQAALAIIVLVLPLLLPARVLPAFGNYGLGVLAIDVLLLYAPYAAIERGRGAWAAIRESVQLVSDHLATTLVALLFGFLLTGGMALLVAPLVAALGPYGPFAASILYAPVGTTLALFLYRVYLEFYPKDAVPEAASPAPVAVPTG